MGFDHQKYVRNHRVICYVSAKTKDKISQAMKEGLFPSISKLCSAIMDKYIDKEIEELKEQNEIKAAKRATGKIP